MDEHEENRFQALSKLIVRLDNAGREVWNVSEELLAIRNGPNLDMRGYKERHREKAQEMVGEEAQGDEGRGPQTV